MSRILDFYVKGQYFRNNPTWDKSDTDWKLQKLIKHIMSILPEKNAVVCEIGCGSGELLKKLADSFTQHKFIGWDIAPDAKKFWNHEKANLKFCLGNFTESSEFKKVDLILLIDVLEHLADPGTFLDEIKNKSDAIIVHLPLDMTVVNVICDQRINRLRDTIGHIHYFTKSIGEKLLDECGYEIVTSEYTNAWKDSPNLSFYGKALKFMRHILFWFSPSVNAKVFGGETLILAAKNKDKFGVS